MKLILLCLIASVRSFPTKPKIVLGVPAAEGDFPWQLSLEYLGGHNCGAILVSDTRALTAAHCVEGRTEVPSNYQIHYGHLLRSQPGNRETVTNIEQHPQWISGVLSNPYDIAILSFNTIPENGQTVQRIPRAQPSQGSLVGANCSISGWGHADGSGSMPDDLRGKFAKVITNLECQNFHSGSDIRESHICANGLRGEGAGCNGDSGGPLDCVVDGVAHAAGITSWGVMGCYNAPTVYTRISSFKDFIDPRVPN